MAPEILRPIESLITTAKSVHYCAASHSGTKFLIPWIHYIPTMAVTLEPTTLTLTLTLTLAIKKQTNSFIMLLNKRPITYNASAPETSVTQIIKNFKVNKKDLLMPGISLNQPNARLQTLRPPQHTVSSLPSSGMQAENTSTPRVLDGAAAMDSWAFSRGVKLGTAITSTLSSWYKGRQPADTDELIAVKTKLDAIAQKAHLPVLKSMSMRTKNTLQRLKKLTTLKANLQQLPEVQQALEQCSRAQNRQKNWNVQLKKIQLSAKTATQQLLQSPTQKILSQASTTEKNLTAEQACLSAATEIEAGCDHLENAINIVDKVQQLNDQTNAINALKSALHLSTQWGDSSAFFRELSNYCIQTAPAPQTTLNRQLNTAKQLSHALQELVLLKEDLKIINIIHEIQSSRYQLLPELGNSRPIMPVKTRKRLNDSNQLHYRINIQFQKAVALAQNGVSYWNRFPSEDMQASSQQLTQQLNKTLKDLRKSPTTDTQDPIREYLELTNKTSKFMGDRTIASITSKKLNLLSKDNAR